MRAGKGRMAGWIAAVVLLAAVAAGGMWAWEYFGVDSWQTLDPQRLQQLAQTGAIYDKNGAYVTIE